MTLSPLAYLFWDPYPIAFTVPLIDRPVAWYGILFVAGFLMGYPVMNRLLANHFRCRYRSLDAQRLAAEYTDRMIWYVVAGTLVGARLGHVLFYRLSHFMEHPLEIPMIWQGGLASHGGALGVLLALVFFWRSMRVDLPGFSFVTLLDRIVIPTALVATCIRLGNFCNQEILGYQTTVRWGVIFGHPATGGIVVPRHPVQLYEAGAYLITFTVLVGIWLAQKERVREGLLSGLFFLLVFGARFALEYFKEPLSQITTDDSMLLMGQWLSLPFILTGLLLLLKARPLIDSK